MKASSNVGEKEDISYCLEAREQGKQAGPKQQAQEGEDIERGRELTGKDKESCPSTSGTLFQAPNSLVFFYQRS